MKYVIRCFVAAIILSSAAWAQWSSDPSQNLPLSKETLIKLSFSTANPDTLTVR